MSTLLAQMSPQRSTQYTDLVTDLAPYEVQLSPLGPHLTAPPQPIQLGGQGYLKLSLSADLDPTLHTALATFAMTSAFFQYYEALNGEPGPFLKPLELEYEPFLPHNLIATRRYRGKTNELFTQFMCNIARASSDFASTPWPKLTLLDPLAGGGTTLFAAVTLGADVAGVESDKKVMEGTVAFLKQYMKEGRISAKFREDKLKNVGKRAFVTIKDSARCVIGHGDTTDVAAFVHGLKQPQLIVTDLPYGIQHRGEWQKLLVKALPAWADVLADGGAMVFSWDATRFPRADMIALVEEVSNFRVLDDSPYHALSHQVDRVIKQRDVIVARL